MGRTFEVHDDHASNWVPHCYYTASRSPGRVCISGGRDEADHHAVPRQECRGVGREKLQSLLLRRPLGGSNRARGRQNPDLDAMVSLRDARDLKHLAVLVEDADSCHRLALQKLLSILW